MQTRQARQRTVMPQTQVTGGGLAVQAAVTPAPGPGACDSRSEERVLDHAPLNAAHRLDAVAQALGALMALAHRRVQLPPPEFRSRFGCQDVADPSGLPDPDPAAACNAPAGDELRQVRSALAQLAEEYERIGLWLGREIARGWRIAGDSGAPSGGIALGDHYRIITRDWMAADMSLVLARLLRRVSRTIPSAWPEHPQSASDAVSARTGWLQLQRAAVLLRRTVTLAAEHGDFLCDFDRRWRSLREQTGRLLAPSDPPDRAGCPDA